MGTLSTSRGAQAGYLRWLLIGNPFAQLSSEGLDEVTPFHVVTEVDRELKELVVNTLQSGEKAIIVLVGEFGSGKTQRLRFIAEQIDWADRFYVKIDSDDWTDVARSILGAVRSSILDRLLMKKVGEEAFSDPLRVGRDVAAELNSREYVLFMLDEIENVLTGTRKDAAAFAKFLRELYQRLDGGRVILIACVPEAIRIIGSFLENLGARILSVGPVSPEAAAEIIRKRMAHYRIEGSSPNPYYPFTEKVVRLIAERANYNPRAMIRIARALLSHVTVGEGGKVAIDEERMLEVLGAGRRRVEKARKERPSPPDEIVELFRTRGPFTLREAASALGVGIVEALAVMRKLEREGVVERDRSGRYVIPEKSPGRQSD